MGARRPGATSTRRSWITTSASTTRSTPVASMVMGTMTSRMRVRARARARMKARTSSLRLRGERVRGGGVRLGRGGGGRGARARPCRVQGQAEEHVEDHINVAGV